MNSEKTRINVTFEPEIYEQIRLLAGKEGRSMSEQIRIWSYAGLNGDLSVQNIDFISKIMRDQLNCIISPAVDRLASLSVKTCIQAASATYLSAEAMSSFIPEELQQDFLNAYEAARKKAIIYVKNKEEGV